MKFHNNTKDLLASFSIAHHKWLNTVGDKRTFNQVSDDFLSENAVKEGECQMCSRKFTAIDSHNYHCSDCNKA